MIEKGHHATHFYFAISMLVLNRRTGTLHEIGKLFPNKITMSCNSSLESYS